MADEFGPEARVWLDANAHTFQEENRRARYHDMEIGLCSYMMSAHGLTKQDLEGILGNLTHFIEHHFSQ